MIPLRLAAVSAVSSALLIASGVRAEAPRSVDVQSLVRSSDFVGFVLAQPWTVDRMTDEQGVEVYRVDAIKSGLPRTSPGPPNPAQYPYVGGRSGTDPSRPTRYGDKAYYLVFLGKPTPVAKGHWSTLACYRIDFRPDDAGRIVGRLAGYPQPSAKGDLATLRRLLKRIIAGGPDATAASSTLNPLLASAALATQHEPKTHEERMALAKPLAAAIRPGTLRRDVEKVFLQQDGGLSGPLETRYYVGDEVMVGVPYDRTGGDWKPTNRVTGPLRVYRSLMAVD